FGYHVSPAARPAHRWARGRIVQAPRVDLLPASLPRRVRHMQYVASHGLSIAVREYDAPADVDGPPHGVLVHGYPDNQRMWERVAERLRGAGMHVVTYDVRGAGSSDVPTAVSGYAAELLVDDLVAVVEATVPDGDQVHLVGHDWGSVQLW